MRRFLPVIFGACSGLLFAFGLFALQVSIRQAVSVKPLAMFARTL